MNVNALLSPGLAAVLTLASASFLPAEAQSAREGERGFLGVFLSDDGLALQETVPDSPAAGAGLRAGDRIVALDGRELASSEELLAALSERGPGDHVRVTFARELEVELGGRPDGGDRGWLGVSVDDSDGLRVTEVDAGSPAAGAGLAVGDRIAATSDGEIDSFEGLAEAVGSRSPGDGLGLAIVRTVGLTLGSAPAEDAPPAPEPAPAPEPQRPGYLGVGLGGDGEVVVDTVYEGTAAERFGLKPGDRILAVDSRRISTGAELADAIAGAGAGQSVVLDVLRVEGDQEQFLQIDARLGARPAEADAAPGGPERREVERRMDELRSEMAAITADYQARMQELAQEMRALGRSIGRPMDLEFGFVAPSADHLRFREEAERARAEAMRAREQAERLRAEVRERQGRGQRDDAAALREELRSLRADVEALRRELSQRDR